MNLVIWILKYGIYGKNRVQYGGNASKLKVGIFNDSKNLTI